MSVAFVSNTMPLAGQFNDLSDVLVEDACPKEDMVAAAQDGEVVDKNKTTSTTGQTPNNTIAGQVISVNIPPIISTPSREQVLASFPDLPAALRSSVNGKWYCDICGLPQDSKDDLLTHRIMHLACEGNQCPICKKKFATPTNVKNHLTVHTGVKKYK